jgi:putative addiction module CopG family antidote
MTIHLPEHLERYVHDRVVAGRFRSEEDVIRDALERHRQAQQPPAAPAMLDPVLGCMRDDAELM